MTADQEQYLNRDQIKEIIPHREPFLLIDEIREIVWGKSAIGVIYDVGIFSLLEGHFPGYPVMPGALLVEALAQVGAVTVLGLPENHGKIAMLTGLDAWKFRKPAFPEHEIFLEGNITALRSNYGKGHGRATSEGQLLAEGDLSFAIVERPKELNLPGLGKI